MVAIPRNEDDLIRNIYNVYEKEAGTDLYLARIGASSIGGDCMREIWLSWRGASVEKIEGRILRLFESGNIQEERVIKDLRSAGLSVWDRSEDNKQFSKTDDTGHFVVKPDGVVKNVPGAELEPHLLEIKSSNDKNFQDLKKNRLKKSKPDHYAQIQIGMHFFGVKRGLYVVVNKNNDEYYIERVKLDEEEVSRLLARIDSLIDYSSPPPRISESPAKYPCGWCSQNDACFKTQPLAKNCRTCLNSSPIRQEGIWCCSLTGESLTYDDQKKGCDKWAPIFT